MPSFTAGATGWSAHTSEIFAHTGRQVAETAAPKGRYLLLSGNGERSAPMILLAGECQCVILLAAMPWASSFPAVGGWQLRSRRSDVGRRRHIEQLAASWIEACRGRGLKVGVLPRHGMHGVGILPHCGICIG